jgi:hypothetical protein
MFFHYLFLQKIYSPNKLLFHIHINEHIVNKIFYITYNLYIILFLYVHIFMTNKLQTIKTYNTNFSW